jgi:hypothetical protein
MAQTLEFSATDGMTLTATRCAVGAYTGTAADSVTQQAGTNRYLAVFTAEVTGAYRLDFKSGGTTIGTEVYDLSGSGTFQPRAESGLTAAGVRSAVGLASANLDTQLGDLPTAAEVADAVWDEALSGHTTTGTAGDTLSDAASAVTVTPLTGVVENRVSGTTINLFVGETQTVAVACVDAEGDAVTLTGLTLELVIETLTGTDVEVIADASITKSGSTFSFVVPTTVTASQRTLRWALRKTTDGAVLMHGKMPVTKAAKSDL